MPIVSVRPGKRGGPVAECVCDHCEKLFNRRLYKAKRPKSRHTFCLPACYHAFREAHRKPYKNAQGYMCVSREARSALVHRLVMEEALGRKLTPNELVHHRDENKTNNPIENLELRTRSNHGHVPGYVDVNLKTINFLLQENASLKQRLGES